ncbi:MAG: hypothetical protein ACPGVD_03865 [Flavobacteriales bacterium]
MDRENDPIYFESFIKNGDAFIVEDNFQSQVKEIISLESTITKSDTNYSSCFTQLDKLKN